MSGWDDDQQWNNDQQWENGPPPPPPPPIAPSPTAPPPMYENSFLSPQTDDNAHDNVICQGNSQKIRKFGFLFFFFMVAGQFFLGGFDFIFDSEPPCQDSPNGIATIYHDRRISFESANSDCKDMRDSKVVSILDEEHYDFIKNVKIQSCYYKV